MYSLYFRQDKAISYRVNYICADLKARDGRCLIGNFIPTDRNGLAQELYSDFGFAKAASGRWELDLKSFRAQEIPWIRSSGPKEALECTLRARAQLITEAKSPERIAELWFNQAENLGLDSSLLRKSFARLQGENLPPPVLAKLLALETLFVGAANAFLRAEGGIEKQVHCHELPEWEKSIRAAGYDVINKKEMDRIDNRNADNDMGDLHVVYSYTYGRPGTYQRIDQAIPLHDGSQPTPALRHVGTNDLPKAFHSEPDYCGDRRLSREHIERIFAAVNGCKLSSPSIVGAVLVDLREIVRIIGAEPGQWRESLLKQFTQRAEPLFPEPLNLGI